MCCTKHESYRMLNDTKYKIQTFLAADRPRRRRGRRPPQQRRDRNDYSRQQGREAGSGGGGDYDSGDIGATTKGDYDTYMELQQKEREMEREMEEDVDNKFKGEAGHC